MNNLCQLLTTLVLYKEGELLTVLRTLFSSNQNGSVFFYPQCLFSMIALEVVMRLT